MSAPVRARVEPGIYRRASGGLEIAFRDAQGKQRRRSVEGGIAAARKALTAEAARRDRGERLPANRRLTFNDAADAWWSANATRLAPNTQAVYSAALEHLRPHFGARRMEGIDADALARYVANPPARRRHAKRGPLKGATLRTHVSVLGLVFRYAQRRLGLVAADPTASLEPGERPSTDDAREHRVLSPDERERLIAAVDEPHRLVFQTAADTGARMGEVLGLTWQDVNLHPGAESLTFTRQHADRRRLKTKSSRRTIEITPGLAAELREHGLASDRGGEHDLVFTSRAGTGLDAGNVGQRVMRRAVKAAGLDDLVVGGEVLARAPTFHDLRHTHASELIASGWDVAEVSERLGHRDITTTMRVYVHEFNAAGRSAGRRARLEALRDGSGMAAPDSTAAHCALDLEAADLAQARAIRPAAHHAAPPAP